MQEFGCESDEKGLMPPNNNTSVHYFKSDESPSYPKNAWKSPSKPRSDENIDEKSGKSPCMSESIPSVASDDSAANEDDCVLSSPVQAAAAVEVNGC
jgi:hypothetical protein